VGIGSKLLVQTQDGVAGGHFDSSEQRHRFPLPGAGVWVAVQTTGGFGLWLAKQAGSLQIAYPARLSRF
jgi:hypothetical protein